MKLNEYFRKLESEILYAHWHLEECCNDDCETCDYLLEFYSACDGCGHWMNKEVFYHYHQDTGHTYCGSCEEKFVPIV